MEKPLADYLAIGSVRTSHGVKGLLKVQSYSGEVDHFWDLKDIYLKDRKGRKKRFTVERVVPNGQEILMKLQGIDTPEVGKSYANWEIWVPREQAAPCEEGEFYFADLTGCELYHGDLIIGQVLCVLEAGGGDLLEIKRGEGENIFVPFRDEFIGDVNVKERKIELKELWVIE